MLAGGLAFEGDVQWKEVQLIRFHFKPRKSYLGIECNIALAEDIIFTITIMTIPPMVAMVVMIVVVVVVVFYLSDMGETVTYLSQNTKEWCADDSPGHRWPLGH